MHLKYMYPKVWRDSSAVRNTLCSCRGKRFSSQNPHGAHTSVTILLGNLMPSFDLQLPGTHTGVHTYTDQKQKQKKSIKVKTKMYNYPKY